MGRQRVMTFFRGSYRPENILIVAAGNLKHERLARLVRKAFAGMEPGGDKARRAPLPRQRVAARRTPSARVEERRSDRRAPRARDWRRRRRCAWRR